MTSAALPAGHGLRFLGGGSYTECSSGMPTANASWQAANSPLQPLNPKFGAVPAKRGIKNGKEPVMKRFQRVCETVKAEKVLQRSAALHLKMRFTYISASSNLFSSESHG